MSLPNDVLREILLESDLPTIIKICTSHKNNSLCNNYFWIEKFDHDHLNNYLPQSELSFDEWTLLYNKVIKAKEEATQLIHMYVEYHRSDSKINIILEFNGYAHKILDKAFIDLLKIEYFIIVNYDLKLNKWTVMNNQYKQVIDYKGLHYIITQILLNYNEYKYDITDDDEHLTLIYDRLIKNKYNHDPEAKAYRMGYRLLKGFPLFK